MRSRAWLASLCLLGVAGCADDGPASVASFDDGRFRNPFGEVCSAPCLFGAVLGETSRHEAAELAAAQDFVAGTTRSEVPDETRFYGRERSVTLRGDGVLDTVWMSIDDGSLTWSDVLDTMGAPRSVRLALHGETEGGYVSWFYDRIVLTSWLHDDRLSPDDPVDAIEITTTPSGYPYFPVALNAISFIHHEIPGWEGFAGVAAYLRHPRCRIAVGSPIPAGEPCRSGGTT